MIGADPAGYIDWTLASWSVAKSLAAFSSPALASYRAQLADKVADKAVGQQIVALVHFLGAKGGFPAQTGDPTGLWRQCRRGLTIPLVLLPDISLV